MSKQYALNILREKYLEKTAAIKKETEKFYSLREKHIKQIKKSVIDKLNTFAQKEKLPIERFDSFYDWDDDAIDDILNKNNDAVAIDKKLEGCACHQTNLNNKYNRIRTQISLHGLDPEVIKLIEEF